MGFRWRCKTHALCLSLPANNEWGLFSRPTRSNTAGRPLPRVSNHLLNPTYAYTTLFEDYSYGRNRRRHRPGRRMALASVEHSRRCRRSRCQCHLCATGNPFARPRCRHSRPVLCPLSSLDTVHLLVRSWPLAVVRWRRGAVIDTHSVSNNTGNRHSWIVRTGFPALCGLETADNGRLLRILADLK